VGENDKTGGKGRERGQAKRGRPKKGRKKKKKKKRAGG